MPPTMIHLHRDSLRLALTLALIPASRSDHLEASIRHCLLLSHIRIPIGDSDVIRPRRTIGRVQHHSLSIVQGILESSAGGYIVS